MHYKNYAKKGGFSLLYRPVKKSPLKCTFQLSGQDHPLATIQASDVDHLGSPDGITAARADIFPGGACSGCGWWGRRGVCACSSDPVSAVFVPIDEDVTQIVIQAELQETVTGACDCPSVLVVMMPSLH